MRCNFCGKEKDEIPLFEGIYYSEMINSCEPCAEEQNVPLIKKPSIDKIEKANKRYTVRERMERMSGVRDTTEISEEQSTVQGNLAKLRRPREKEMNESLFEDYYWRVNIARRREKLSIGQLAEKIGIDREILTGIEKGKLPKNFNEIFLKLEVFFKIGLLKNHEKKINFIRKSEQEEEILNAVREKMNNPKEELSSKEKEDVLEKIESGKADFSRKTNLQNVTLNDLVELRKKREEDELKRKRRKQTDDLLGDDVELEF